MAAKPPSTRDRMIVSTALLVREHGASATSIDDVLKHSGAPRGSVYHHFPGGREQLLEEATRFAGEYVARHLDLHDAADPLQAFDAFIGQYADALAQSGSRSGCPVAAVAVESEAAGDGALQAAGEAFATWQKLLAQGLHDAGIPKRRATDLSLLAIASVEGALLMSKAQRDPAPLHGVRAQLRRMLHDELTTTEKDAR